jgi:anti-sigma factor RsiW
MKDSLTHPARLPDFLSRLHDGELSPAERAHFESHGAHCSECRQAAAEFEAALKLFRSSRASPPPSDLSARILRKLQASSPRRRLFGTVFGIDVKWASGFAVAALAAVVGLAIVIDREMARRASLSQTRIPVVLREGEGRAAAPASPSAGQAQNAPVSAAGRAAEEGGRRDSAPQPPSALRAERETAPPAVPAAEPGRAQAYARETGAKRDETAELAPRQRSMVPQRSKSLEKSGGEGAAVSSMASAEPGAPARLVVLSVDGEGNPPAVVSPGAAEALAGLRGQRFSLLVEAGGRVREAHRDGGTPGGRRMPKDASVAAAPAPVWSLRFAPGDRPRRLLLRVE